MGTDLAGTMIHRFDVARPEELVTALNDRFTAGNEFYKYLKSLWPDYCRYEGFRSWHVWYSDVEGRWGPPTHLISGSRDIILSIMLQPYYLGAMADLRWTMWLESVDLQLRARAVYRQLAKIAGSPLVVYQPASEAACDMLEWELEGTSPVSEFRGLLESKLGPPAESVEDVVVREDGSVTDWREGMYFVDHLDQPLTPF